MGELKPCLHFSSWRCLYKAPPARCSRFSWFFYIWHQKYFVFFVTCFRDQCFPKSRRGSQGGKRSVRGSGCDAHLLYLPAGPRCFASWAAARRRRRQIQASEEQDLAFPHPMTYSGFVLVFLFCFVFFNMEPYIFFLSDLRSECDF